jgi:hypothetical protein
VAEPKRRRAVKPRLFLALAAACALLPARATTAWSQDNVAKQEASARLKAGLALANQGKWDKARLSFVQAYAVLPSADLLWNLAFAELKSGHPLDALQHFDAYEIEAKAEPAKIAALPKFRDRAYQQIGRIKVQAPAGALAWLDGAAQAWAEPINVAPGEHRLKVQIGEQSEERRVTVAAGQTLAPQFAPIEPVTPKGAGDVAGAPVPSTSSAPTSPDPTSSAPPDSAASPVPATPSSPSLTLGWIGVGAGAGALAAGVGFALAASAKASDVKAARASGSPFTCSAQPAPPICGDLQDAASKHDTYSKVSTVSLVAGGVLGIAGVGYLLLAPSSRAVAVAPYAAPRESGLILRTQF